MNIPNIILNWPAIGVSVIAAFIFGGLWYGPLFGKTWAQLMNFKMDQKPDPKVMKRAFILQIIGTFLATYVLAHTGQVWRPSVWGVGEDAPAYVYGFFNAFFIWLGFYIPMQLGKISWEMRPWKLFFINVSHDLINLLIISMILAFWR